MGRGAGARKRSHWPADRKRLAAIGCEPPAAGAAPSLFPKSISEQQRERESCCCWRCLADTFICLGFCDWDSRDGRRGTPRGIWLWQSLSSTLNKVSFAFLSVVITQQLLLGEDTTALHPPQLISLRPRAPSHTCQCDEVAYPRVCVSHTREREQRCVCTWGAALTCVSTGCGGGRCRVTGLSLQCLTSPVELEEADCPQNLGDSRGGGCCRASVVWL